MEDKDHFIIGIHNYCDRWCERCEFTMRCEVFAAEAEMTDDEKDVGSEAFVRNLSNMLHEARTMLEDKAAEFGIEITDSDLDDAAVKIRRDDDAVESSDLACLADKYADELRCVLAAQEDWLAAAEIDEDALESVLSVLYWYRYFIGAKIHRGLGGVIDDDGNEDVEELMDPQSDANGSIKVALIAIERSILAWTYLLGGDNSDVIKPMIEMLESLKTMAEARFPVARDFIRPGFDEIETVM